MTKPQPAQKQFEAVAATIADGLRHQFKYYVPGKTNRMMGPEFEQQTEKLRDTWKRK